MVWIYCKATVLKCNRVAGRVLVRPRAFIPLSYQPYPGISSQFQASSVPRLSGDLTNGYRAARPRVEDPDRPGAGAVRGVWGLRGGVPDAGAGRDRRV